MSEVEPNLCFVDTNIWLYAFIQVQDRDKTATAKAIIQSNKIVISSQVISEVCVNLIKKAAFDEASIRELIQSF
jgi:predicted nucleic acid-binding protein